MGSNHAIRQDHLFTVRLWQEEKDDDEREWRGRIYDAATGDVRYFRDWACLIPLLLAMINKVEQHPAPGPSTQPGMLGPDA